MTKENKVLAYELYLRHWPYARIAAQLGAKQGDVIRAVADAERRQNTLCARCRWRKDGLEACLLPVCMYGVGRPRTKSRRKLWSKKRF